MRKLKAYASMLAVIAFGCGSNDKEARVVTQSGARPIAVGAHQPVTLADACLGGGFSGCRSEQLTEVSEIASGDEEVVLPHRVSELDGRLGELDVAWVLEGRGAGSTEVTLTGTFEDGTERRSMTEFEVAEADSLEVSPACPGGAGEAQLFPPGREVPISVRLFSGSRELRGLVLDVLDGAQLTQRLTTNGTITYDWVAPETPGVVGITSELFRGLSVELTTYDPKEVVIAKVRIPEVEEFPKGQAYGIGVEQVVEDQPPCFPAPLRIRTGTPEVCTGPEGAEEWSSELGESFQFVPAVGGTCRLSVAAEGSETWTDSEFAYGVYE